jgi:hypothetical protein
MYNILKCNKKIITIALSHFINLAPILTLNKSLGPDMGFWG